MDIYLKDAYLDDDGIYTTNEKEQIITKIKRLIFPNSVQLNCEPKSDEPELCLSSLRAVMFTDIL